MEMKCLECGLYFTTNGSSVCNKCLNIIEPVVFFKLLEGGILPKRQTNGSVGYDIYIPKEIITPQALVMIPLGFKIDLPEGYYAEIHPRSSLMTKHSLLANIGIIDTDYRGEVHLILLNFTNYPITFKKGKRIAQLIIKRVETIPFKVSEILTQTERGDGGFGSTGD